MLTILLVEDKEAIVLGLEYLLKEEGYRLLAAEDVKSAREILAKEQPDLVLLDVALPDGTGFDLCREIKAKDLAPVIFLTARDEERDGEGGTSSTVVTVEGDGFSVQANEYYRQAVEELDFPMKPCRYELDLEPTGQDAGLLRTYLERHLRPGEEVQLWSVWVPRYPEDGLSRYRGRLEDLDGDALAPLEGWNVCMTVER